MGVATLLVLAILVLAILLLAILLPRALVPAMSPMSWMMLSCRASCWRDKGAEFRVQGAGRRV